MGWVCAIEYIPDSVRCRLRSEVLDPVLHEVYVCNPGTLPGTLKAAILLQRSPSLYSPRMSSSDFTTSRLH
jgi:hypothetical protein